MNAAQPFARRQADGIARAFLPVRWWGNRYDYYYTREKLASDPLYPGVLQALRGTEAPLLDLFLIEKAAYEIRYEAANRPGWLGIPLGGLQRIIERVLPTETFGA